MKFCSDCGGPVRRAVPPGDSLDRHICDACDRVFYTNPNMIVGTLPRWGSRILLCKRSIEPRLGYWTLPSGFLEDGETTEEGAARETREEAGVDVDLGPLFSVFNLPHVNQVYLLYLANLRGPELPGSTPESAELRLFSPEEIPWPDIAFRAIEFCLKRYLDPDQPGDAHVHVGSYIRRANS